MIAPGTALREGIESILHARTGGLIVIGEPEDLSFLNSGGIKLDIDYTPAFLYQLAKMDGAIILNANATKITMANVQLMPDPTILSHETGTSHRTAERVSKQTDALVIAISQRREVVSVYVDGVKYILEDIPVVLAKANQALATLDKFRTPPGPGLHAPDGARVRGRRDAARRADRAAALRAGDAHGGRDRALHRRARQRGPADRDAARGDDGRGRRREVGARARLPRPSDSDEAFAAALEEIGRLVHQDLLDFGRLAELLGYDRKLNTLDYPVSPRGYRVLGRIPRLPKLVVSQIVAEFGGLDELLAAERRRARGGRGRGRDPGEGHPRGPAPAAGAQPRGSIPADLNQRAAQVRRAQRRRTPFPYRVTEEAALD